MIYQVATGNHLVKSKKYFTTINEIKDHIDLIEVMTKKYKKNNFDMNLIHTSINFLEIDTRILPDYLKILGEENMETKDDFLERINPTKKIVNDE
ncbi:MAG: hypothetical protein KGI50_05380 [Patescibacteria group bacterium]|nr:hypothetical protein [Patescibacteria group bacterium]MDE2438763.1 hypothetical protein [Patescibacteria group bacterium]